MTPQEKEQVSTWSLDLAHDICIRLLLTQDERSREIDSFCEELARHATRVQVQREQVNANTPPVIRVNDFLEYQGVPLGMELGPFLEALAFSNRKKRDMPEERLSRLEKLDIPILLRLYVAPQCAFCPEAARKLISLAFASEYIYLSIIDGTLFTEMAESDMVQSVPTLLLDKKLRWTGSFRLEEILDIIVDRDPAGLSASSLEKMLAQGRADDLGKMMLERKDIFPAFIDLLVHEAFSARLGAMAVMEEITERNPRLAKQVIDPLWERFPYAGDTIKGDILYVIGETGDSKARPRLEEIMRGPYAEEVKAAAKEALENLAAIDKGKP